jgi:hypothetical protein
MSGHSAAKIKRIKNYWLEHPPEQPKQGGNHRYLLFDGTYFHKDGCLISIMDAVSGRIILCRYVTRENYRNAFELFTLAKRMGIMPKAVTLDGHLPVMHALHDVWPDTIVQRCLYHIQREGMRWLRSHPKSEAGQRLRFLLSGLSGIGTQAECTKFWADYDHWLALYGDYVRCSPVETVAQKDLKKTRVLINHARGDMFHYLRDANIASTTNRLEGFHSRLKADYRRHRGMSKAHRIAYLQWYCYLKNA